MDIEIKNVTKSFTLGQQLTEVLKGISCHIPAGRTVAIVGQSGVGKTTLLSLLGTLDHPTSGEIRFGGETVQNFSDERVSWLRQQKIGFVFQDFNLLPQLSLYENIEISATAAHSQPEHILDLLTRVGLQSLRHHKPNQVSGGQQQRAAIARALVNDPDIILADEPTGNLDPHTSAEILDLLFGLQKERKNTLLMVTHSPAILERVELVYTLRDGDLECTVNRLTA